jgi:hypothetical protein
VVWLVEASVSEKGVVSIFGVAGGEVHQNCHRSENFKSQNFLIR